MNRLLYVAPAELNLLRSNGVCKKILQQTKVLENYFDVELIGYDGNNIVSIKHETQSLMSKVIKHLPRRFSLYCYVLDFFNCNCDIHNIYIRYFGSDLLFIYLLKKFKKDNSKIVLEIPTYPYKMEMLNYNFGSRLLYSLDFLFRNFLKKYVNYIATFSLDQTIHGIPCLNLVNGIIVDDIVSKKPLLNTKNSINLIAVSTMESWHGYDRLIEGLRLYYESGGTRNIIFHIVGSGNMDAQYQSMVDNYKLSKHVIFHGFQSGKELDEIYDQCEIGVECFGAHRKGLYLSSSLKSREYVAKGLPVITSCKIDIFPSDYPYVLTFPADESPIDINKIVTFYDEVYVKSGKSKEEIINEIRDFAYKTCDMSVAMKPVIDYIKGTEDA